MVTPIDVHGARATDALAAAAAEGEGWIYLILYLDEGVQEHGTTLLRVYVVRNVLWGIFWVIWIGSVNIEPFHMELVLF